MALEDERKGCEMVLEDAEEPRVAGGGVASDVVDCGL